MMMTLSMFLRMLRLTQDLMLPVLQLANVVSVWLVGWDQATGAPGDTGPGYCQSCVRHQSNNTTC